MIEFKTLKPDGLLGFIDEDLTVDVILNGQKNALEKMGEKSFAD